MNRTDTEAAISGHLPRRARRHLDAIMAAVDAHATAGREDLNRVLAEGARRQKLVAEEFQAVKAERDELATELRNLNSAEGSARAEAAELGKQVRVLVEERAAALAEGNRLRQELAGADAQLEIRTNMITNLEAERDRLRQQAEDLRHAIGEMKAQHEAGLAAVSQRHEAEIEQAGHQIATLNDDLARHAATIAELAAKNTGLPDGWDPVTGMPPHDPARERTPGHHSACSCHLCDVPSVTPAPGGDAEPAQNRARKPAAGRTGSRRGTGKGGGSDAPRDADGGAE